MLRQGTLRVSQSLTLLSMQTRERPVVSPARRLALARGSLQERHPRLRRHHHRRAVAHDNGFLLPRVGPNSPKTKSC